MRPGAAACERGGEAILEPACLATCRPCEAGRQADRQSKGRHDLQPPACLPLHGVDTAGEKLSSCTPSCQDVGSSPSKRRNTFHAQAAGSSSPPIRMLNQGVQPPLGGRVEQREREEGRTPCSNRYLRIQLEVGRLDAALPTAFHLTHKARTASSRH